MYVNVDANLIDLYTFLYFLKWFVWNVRGQQSHILSEAWDIEFPMDVERLPTNFLSGELIYLDIAIRFSACYELVNNKAKVPNIDRYPNIDHHSNWNLYKSALAANGKNMVIKEERAVISQHIWIKYCVLMISFSFSIFTVINVKVAEFLNTILLS